MPILMMENLHNIPSSSSVFGRSTLPTLTTQSMMLFRQQMDESTHEMVILLTQQVGTVFNPFIQTTNQGYQALATQMRRIANFFTPPQTVYQQIPHIQNIPQAQITRHVQIVEPVVQRQQPIPRPQPVEPIVQAQPEVILVGRNHDTDELVRNVQQQSFGA